MLFLRIRRGVWHSLSAFVSIGLSIFEFGHVDLLDSLDRLRSLQ